MGGDDTGIDAEPSTRRRDRGHTPFVTPGGRFAVGVGKGHPDALTFVVADPAGHPFDLGPVAVLSEATVRNLHEALGAGAAVSADEGAVALGAGDLTAGGVLTITAGERGLGLERAAAAAGEPGGEVLDAEPVERPPCRSPLDADPVTGDYPTVLRGGGVTDLGEVERIRARIAYTRLPWWRRWTTPRPAGWSR